MAMSVKRYIAIEHPMFYRRAVTNKKVVVAIVLLWITEPTAYILNRLETHRSGKVQKLPTAIFVGFNALIILLCTLKVQITAHRQRRAIVNAERASAQYEEQQNRLKEYKNTFTMVLMVLASVLLYLPIIIVTIIETIEGKEVTADFKYISIHISLLFIYLQSLINPIIFSFRLTYIREGLKKKLYPIN